MSDDVAALRVQFRLQQARLDRLKAMNGNDEVSAGEIAQIERLLEVIEDRLGEMRRGEIPEGRPQFS